MEINRADALGDISSLGLTSPEAKQLLARVQQEVVAAQAHEHAVLRPECGICRRRCHVKDWRLHQIATLFGGVTVRLPRFLCAVCGRVHGRSPETLRRHALDVGEQLRNAAAVNPASAASAITVTLDSTFIRSCHDSERHLEVRVGNAETDTGGRQVFGAVARAGTDIEALIRRNLETVGRTTDTELSAFTDGCPGLRSILADAGIAKPPILDWFHIAMRLQHAKQAASGLSTDTPVRMQAKTVIVDEVERLRWRIWHGKAKNARLTLDRIRKVMHAFKGERSCRTMGVPSRKLWTALHEINGYLSSQSSWLVNYAKRYRAGLRVGTAVTEGTANFLVNRRMNKSQQMRWSRRGADLLLQVRCAIYNGSLGSGFGHLFEPVANPDLQLVKAA